MERLNQLENYFVDLDDITINYIESELKNYEYAEYLDKLLGYLDCTRTWANGLRPMQTVDFTYRRELSKYLYVLNLIDEESKDDYIVKLLDRHNANIEYEKDIKPIIYDPKKYKKSQRKKKSKDKEDKPSAKIVKAAAKIKKLGMLKFKAIKNENSV